MSPFLILIQSPIYTIYISVLHRSVSLMVATGSQFSSGFGEQFCGGFFHCTYLINDLHLKLPKSNWSQTPKLSCNSGVSEFQVYFTLLLCTGLKTEALPLQI